MIARQRGFVVPDMHSMKLDDLVSGINQAEAKILLLDSVGTGGFHITAQLPHGRQAQRVPTADKQCDGRFFSAWNLIALVQGNDVERHGSHLWRSEERRVGK